MFNTGELYQTIVAVQSGDCSADALHGVRTCVEEGGLVGTSCVAQGHVCLEINELWVGFHL